MTISALPPAPSPSDAPAQFNAKAFAFVAALPQFASEANATALAVDADAATATAQAAIATAQAAIATTKAGEAIASADAAAMSAAAAATSATAAANSFDAFDDRYLGSKASDPVTDNDGNALQVGALYWNTTVNEMRVWNGASWQIAAGSLVGNADTATKLQTPRMINGTSFDGSADITTAKWGTARTITIGNTGKSFDGSANVSWSLAEIGALDVAATSFGGNAATATKLQTAHTINGTSFDGSANITTANWGTARTITIGNTGKSFDGGANVSWSLDEIGVTAFGLGGTAASVPGNNIDDNTVPTGFYYVASTTSGTKPAGDDGAGHLIVSRGGSGTTARQLYLDNTSARISTRVYVDAAWSEWCDLYRIPANPTIVGLVQVATGGGAGTYTRIDENFAPYSTDAAFFNNHPTYSGIVTQTIDGQQMVKIPKFYFKAGAVPSGTYAGKTYWMISNQPVSGFSVHPAFIGAGGVELDNIWVGKYQAGYDGSSKAQSIAGVLPMVSMDFPTARARAYARNTGGVTGFRLWSYYDISAIQMLATIEMGGLDMQALIGQGRVSQTSAANVDAADVAQATWRGIVGLWGNVWQMVDGLKRSGGNWHRWQYNAPGNTTTSDFATGYINTGRAALTSNGYPVTFDTTLLSAGIIVPATVDGTASNGSTGDYFYSDTDTTDQIAYHGGAWSHGASAGLFDLAVATAPSDANSGFGARLAKV